MALDGITISNIVNELKEKLLGGRIDKVYQPEKDEIILPIKSLGKTYKLMLSANSSNPRLHFINVFKENPMQAPLFCMVLRKHINGGKIINITQPDFERIINIHISSLNELGDVSTKILVIEIMGKHSNIMLLNDQDIVLDSIKHISFDKSAVRQILPGKKYVFPPNQNKLNPLNITYDDFKLLILDNEDKIQSVIYKSFSGISPIIAKEVCFRSEISENIITKNLNDIEINTIYKNFNDIMDFVKTNSFTNEVIYDDKNKIFDFSSIPMLLFKDSKKEIFEDISNLLEFFYSKRDLGVRINQKTLDLKKFIQTNIDRCLKKKVLQTKTLKDIENRDKLKILGELITANIYSIEKGSKEFTTQNYYDENLRDISIKLDENLTPIENAQKYFKKYNKEKRTFIALQDQIKQNDLDLKYLETVMSSLSFSPDENDINEIRDELYEQGFLKKRKLKKGEKPKKSKPFHYISSDGFHIYVGKNNKQNDELTLKFATGNDLWLHTKDIPGSHIIIKTENKDVPDKTLNEACNLAAYYSQSREGSNVPVDCVLKKYVKKPSGAKPGMVIFTNNKTYYITPSESIIDSIKKEK